MAEPSGLIAKTVARKGSKRFLVHWRARLFMADKIIRPAIVTAAYSKGFAIQYPHALPLGQEMNLEFAVNFNSKMVKIRIKARVDYCLIKSTGNDVDIDISITKISREDSHTLNNILHILAQSKEFNLQI